MAIVAMIVASDLQAIASEPLPFGDWANTVRKAPPRRGLACPNVHPGLSPDIRARNGPPAKINEVESFLLLWNLGGTGWAEVNLVALPGIEPGF